MTVNTNNAFGYSTDYNSGWNNQTYQLQYVSSDTCSTWPASITTCPASSDTCSITTWPASITYVFIPKEEYEYLCALRAKEESKPQQTLEYEVSIKDSSQAIDAKLKLITQKLEALSRIEESLGDLVRKAYNLH